MLWLFSFFRHNLLTEVIFVCILSERNAVWSSCYIYRILPRGRNAV